MNNSQLAPTIVLVRPDNSLEVGAVARAMNNLGVFSLVLVAPKNYDPTLARVTGCWSERILDELQVVTTLKEAVANCAEVVGEYSGWWSSDAACFSPSPPLIKANVSNAEGNPETALVFWGSTPPCAGELEICSRLWRCPAEIESAEASFSQRVLLLLYDLRRSHKAITARTGRSSPAPQSELAALAVVMEKLCDRLAIFEAAERTQLHQLLFRTAPTRRELAMMLSFLGKVLRSLGQCGARNTSMDNR